MHIFPVPADTLPQASSTPESTYDDGSAGIIVQGSTVIPRIMNMMVLETADTGQCLGFTLTYFDGEGYTTYHHHKDGVYDSGIVRSKFVGFPSETFLSAYQISDDANYPGQSIAFQFALSDDSTFSCGHLDTGSIVDQSSWEIG